MEKERFLVKAAAHLVLKKENKVLLLLRQNTGHRDGEYGLIAGHVERGELIKECLIREAQEEAGIHIPMEQIKFFHTFSNTKREYVNFFFLVEEWEGEVTNMEPEKCAELKWFDMDALPENTIPYIVDAIEAYKKGETFSENDLDY